MGFGLSGSTVRTDMVGADASIAWVDSAAGTPNAQDYYLSARSPVRINSCCLIALQLGQVTSP